jgi:membrane-bound lytic murein transglycosylase B
LARVVATGAALLALSVPAAAQPGGDAFGFGGYLQLLAARARGQGVSERTIATIVPQISFNPRVVELDRGQPGGGPQPVIPPFAPYLAQHVDHARIARGRAEFAASARWIEGVERSYGVPGPILLAIWGNESNYGAYTGDFDLFRSLATLAFAANCSRRNLSTRSRWSIAAFRVRKWSEAGRARSAIRNSCPALICAWRVMAMVTGLPTSGRTVPIRSPRSPTISATPAGARASHGGLRSAFPKASIAAR